MARVVSLTLFLISWLLLFSYAASYSEPSECQVCTKVVNHIYQQVQNNEARICPKKVEKVFDPTDVADFICKIQPQIDKLANRACYDLYPDACSVKPPSTKDGITDQPLVPKPSNDAEMVKKDSKQKTKVNKKLPINKVSKKIKKKDPSVGYKLEKWSPSFWDTVALIFDFRRKDDR